MKFVGMGTALVMLMTVTAPSLSGCQSSQPKVTHLNSNGSVSVSQGGKEGPADSQGNMLPSGDNNTDAAKSAVLAIATVADTKSVPEPELVQAFGPDFDNWRNDMYKNILPLLNNERRQVLNNGFLPTTPKSLWSDQDIYNVLTYDIADATMQDTKSLGQRMLPTVLSPRSPGYQATYDNSEGGSTANPSPTINVYRADGNPYPRIGSDTFMGIGNLTQNARLIYGSYVRDGNGNDNMATPHIVMLADLEFGNDGDTSLWRKLGFWNVDDVEFQQAAPKLG